jgi:hypothetical protein
LRKIPTDEVPQADRFEKIFDVVEAVMNGKFRDEELARECDLASKRQGGYYRLAAKSLKLIEEDEDRWLPTLLGETIANIDDHDQKIELMRGLVLINPIVRVLFVTLDDSYPEGLPKSELTSIVMNRTDLSRSTSQRRVDTVIRWFRYLRLVSKKKSTYLLKPY